MLPVIFSYDPYTQTVSLLTTAGGTYRLLEVSGLRACILAEQVGTGIRFRLGRDGVYKLQLQEVSMVEGELVIIAESEICYHLELHESLCRDMQFYMIGDMHGLLCNRYTRQKAVLAYGACNMLVANALLKGGCGC